MNKIECSFCHNEIEIDKSKVKSSGKAKIITCHKCSRSVTIEYNGKKYYEVIEDEK